MIAITGADGQLGQALLRTLGSRSAAYSRRRLDITDAEQITRRLDEFGAEQQPLEAVVNCAAYTAVDQAESDVETCRLVNVMGVQNLARTCDRLGCLFVQISSDYVFGADSSREAPYAENDPTGPLNEYGRSKCEGERVTRELENHLIVRTCGLYGRTAAGKNFAETMLRLGGERKSLRVVNDQVCCPSYADHVASGIVRLIDLQARGTFHVVNSGVTTWFEFAREIFRQSAMNVQVEPITSEQFGAAAKRPSYSVLSTDKYAATVGKTPPSWQAGLAEYLTARSEEQPARR